MGTLSILWTALALAGPVGALRAPEDPEWTERLFYPLLRAPRVNFFVSVEDLRGVTLLEPKERVEELRERVDDGEDDLDTQLQLVRALLAAREAEEGARLLEDLSRGLMEELQDEPEDWSKVVQLGEIRRIVGMRFLDPESLEVAARLLQGARASDEELWQASTGLGQLMLWQCGKLRQAGDRDESDVALTRARRLAAHAVEIADDEFVPHALVFIVELTAGSFEHRGDPEAGLEHMIEIAGDLRDAAGYAEEPDVAAAIADTYVALHVIRACQAQWNTMEAFETYALADGTIGPVARDAEAMVDQMGELSRHFRLWPGASLSRWWFARHAQLDDADDLFEEALEAAVYPTMVLESAIGLETRAGHWGTAEAYGERLLEENEDERSLYLTGRLAGLRGDVEGSIESFEEALDLDPELTEASVGLAVSLIKLGEDRERAIEVLEEVLEEDEDVFTAQFALGIALLLEDEKESAVEHLEAALDLAADEGIRDFEIVVEATLEEL